MELMWMESAIIFHFYGLVYYILLLFSFSNVYVIINSVCYLY